MNLLTAHGRFAMRYESGEYAPFANIAYEPIDDTIQPAMMAAAANLSGQLDDCETDDDLDDAVRHFLALFDAGAFSLEQWQQEIINVVEAVCHWARVAELN